MRPKYCVLLFFLVLLSEITLSAREAPYIQFENFTYEEGLPDNTVFQVVKDTSGFMWIATAGGLVRYDGANFKAIHHVEDNEDTPLSNQIKALMVDSENHLWIGTQKNGVSRYDIRNNEYVHFDQVGQGGSKLMSLQILSFMEDSRGRIWIGTESGLNIWDKSTSEMIQFVHNPEDSTSLGAEAVLCTMEDSEGRMWVGTWKGGLNLLVPDKVDFSKSTFKKFKHDPLKKETISENSVWSLYEDSQNRIWVGTFGGGLNLMIPGLNNTNEQSFTAQFVSYKYIVGTPYSLQNNDIYSIVEGDDNYLWIGTGRGLSIIDLNNVGTPFYVDANIAQTVPELNFINYKNSTNVTSMVADIVRNIYVDDTKSYWLSIKGGISKYDKKGIKFTSAFTVHEVDDEKKVEAIVIEDENKHWLAVREQGIIEYQADIHTYTTYRGEKGKKTALNDDTFTSMMQHSDGNLWIGTNSGLSIFDTKRKIFRNYSLCNNKNTQANYTLEDSKGRMWIASNDGLYRVFNVTEDSLEYQVYKNTADDDNIISHNDISCLAEDSKGNIWATTWHGLNKITIGANDKLDIKKYFHNPENPQSLGSDQEMVSVKISDGEMWIANGAGLSHYQSDIDGFVNYNNSDGLSLGGIAAMQIDDLGGVWCSTLQGVFTFSPKSKTFRYFYKEDGLQGNHFGLHSSFKDEEGAIYFGGATGYTTILPKDIEYNEDKPKVVITGFEVFDEERYFDKPIEYTETIRLHQCENFFTIKFSALNYIQSSKNQYAYKLEGFDDDWRYCEDQNFANYTNLDGGEYTFRVKGSNNDGVWNEEGASIKIIVMPPFWQTWWFWTVFIGSVMLIIYLYNKQRIAAIRQRSRELEIFNAKLSSEIEVREKTEQRLREREQKLTQAEKQLEKTIIELQRSNKELEQFAYIASHDLQEPLRMIGSFVQLIRRRYADKIDDAGREYIEFTVDGVNRMSDLIKGLLSFSRMGRQNANFEPCDLNLIVEKKMLDIRKYVKERNAKVTIEQLPEVIFCDATQVGAVFYNLIVNAIKFNIKDQPTVEVNCLKETSQHWLFSVKDNGIGIKPEYKEIIFGIFKRLNANNEFKGSGIGLALCKRIIDNHEGEIWFESEDGEGTTFFFTLNKYLDKEKANIAQEEAESVVV